VQWTRCGHSTLRSREIRTVQQERLEQAYVANAPDLLNYFGRRVLILVDAADLVSETFVVACRRKEHLPTGDEQVRMWLFGVAKHVLANTTRGSTRRFELASKLREHLLTVPVEHPSTEALDIRQALGRLPSDQSELVKLVLWDGFSVPEAAIILEVSESTARGRYQRARTRLGELLSDYQLNASKP